MGSTRLPGKPLLPLAGKPMIQWAYERARRSGARAGLVATDDERIARQCASFGGEVRADRRHARLAAPTALPRSRGASAGTTATSSSICRPMSR